MPIDEVWSAIRGKTSAAELIFLRKCFRAYSSKAHLENVKHDLMILKRMSRPPKKVLDFGCGIGLQSYMLAEQGYTVHGLEAVDDKSLDGFLKGKAAPHIKTRDDSMKSVWDIIRKRADVEFRFYDGKVIPYDRGYFDLVVAYAVIEHIPFEEVGGIISEVGRVLKRQGLLYIFQLPQRTSYTEFIARKLGLESHEFLWDYKRIFKLLARKGLDVIYHEKVDMLINHPYKIVNPLYPLLKKADGLLIHTPLSYFAHHLTVVAKKS